MPLPFTPSNVALTSELPGVYTLYSGADVIYYGRADRNLRSRLESHLRGDEGPCTKAATHYDTEVTFSYTLREEVLLSRYVAEHGRLPRCNEKSAA